MPIPFLVGFYVGTHIGRALVKDIEWFGACTGILAEQQIERIEKVEKVLCGVCQEFECLCE